jgi:hypothetical protein|tara:strand:- start:37 stop:222 length:186 start_codon:yes stop_codon:yes gene_type:complete
MTEEEIQKQLDEINECMKEIQEAKFHQAPKEIIQELQQKIDVLIRESGAEDVKKKERDGFQ